MIKVTSKGNFKKTNSYFEKVLNLAHLGTLDRYGSLGVEALSKATPKDTGLTADSWSYKINREGGKVSIVWSNSNINDNVNVAVLIQYGHATKNGAWVEGIDYVNPAMKSVFEIIADKIWMEVTKA